MTTIEWLSGLYEGEGSLSLSGGKWNLTITMTDEDVVRAAHQFTGVGHVTFVRRQQEHWSDKWRWCVSRREDIYRVATQMLPHLGVRRSAKIHEYLQAYTDARQNEGERRMETSRRMDQQVHARSTTPVGATTTCRSGHPRVKGQPCPTCAAARQRRYRERKAL